MTDYQKLYDGISKIAWGYFFIYFDFNINTVSVSVSIIPSFVGYLLFLSAINYLKDEERELLLLKTLGIILFLWHIVQWFLSWFGVTVDGRLQIADIIICLVNLYFHFQLLTNIASIAAEHQPKGCEFDRKLLWYRTIQTVMFMAITILTNLSVWLREAWGYISIILLLVYIIVCICLMKTLFKFRRCFINK